ncbi:GIY-YIG nuclease family protein [Streptomyces griseosporeus]|uniref:GIY-YIG nuclease family protein n=1 Tax=Streptomyces griseosporeus TaxID=1910 RepID=UPI0036FE16FB
MSQQKRSVRHNAQSGWNARLEGETAVYRLYDVSGQLLYVGISMNPERRWGEHSREKLWWHLVADKRVTWHESREQALIAEEEAERLERPRFGDTHRLGAGWRSSERREDDSLQQGIIDLAETLKQAIAAGRYRAGSRMPTARKLAEVHGVSIAMASFAMDRLAGLKGPLIRLLGGRFQVRP